MKSRIFSILLLLTLFSSNSFADKKIKMGVTWGYTASGFFSPEVDELIVSKVLPNSPAENAGLKVGHKVLSIEDCNIPGCAASKAKDYLKSDSGVKLNFVVENPNGETENIIITVG